MSFLNRVPPLRNAPEQPVEAGAEIAGTASFGLEAEAGGTGNLRTGFDRLLRRVPQGRDPVQEGHSGPAPLTIYGTRTGRPSSITPIRTPGIVLVRGDHPDGRVPGRLVQVGGHHPLRPGVIDIYAARECPSLAPCSLEDEIRRIIR